MTSTTPDTTPQDPVRFRVAAIERFALPDPTRQGHMVLRVEYLNEGDLRGSHFDLSPERYRTYRDAIDAALVSGASYWVSWDDIGPSSLHQQGGTIAERLLRALEDRQVVSE